MDRRTALKLGGLGLVAAGSAATSARAQPAPSANMFASDIKPLKLSSSDAAEMLSFYTPGEYIQQRIFLVDAVYPAGTKETGRLVIQPGDLDGTISFNFVGEIQLPNGETSERSSFVDAMLDMNGHFVTLVRTSYGTHRRTYISRVEGSTTRERIGDGVSGIVGEHVGLRSRSTKTERGFEMSEWLRETPDSDWIPMSENTWEKT